MTEKEFRKLSRADFLELMAEQGREIKRLKEEIEQLKSELASKAILIEESGSIAEAAMGLNRVFEAAQQAADQYTESVKARCERAERETKRRCKEIEEETRRRCEKIVAEAKQRIDAQ